jgi:hypothetical protein
MMKAEDLLKFNFTRIGFSNTAKKITSSDVHLFNQQKINKLNTLSKEIGVMSFSFQENNLIHLVFKKFKSALVGKNVIFERRELRTLTYSLSYSEDNTNSILSNIDELNIALNTINSSWRDSYLIGLIDCLLKNWSTTYKTSLTRLSEFIINKLEKYEGGRVALVKFKTNKHFFESNRGDVILGDNIAKLNLPILEATIFLGVPESWLTYSYFSKVILTWYERKKSIIAFEIENLLSVQKKHNNSITNKRLLSKLIIQANLNEYAQIQENVKKTAFAAIGDPNDNGSWLPYENASADDLEELIQAKKILNEWITRQFIDVFFNVCINDERRKKFWLNLASHISSFQVYGNQDTFNLLKKDKRISDVVDKNRFETFHSNKHISAFILYIGNYMLIEFSNAGYACIAYKLTSEYRPKLNSRLNSADDLRNSSLPKANGSSMNYDEGRLFHQDGTTIWETKFYNWINNYILR